MALNAVGTEADDNEMLLYLSEAEAAGFVKEDRVVVGMGPRSSMSSSFLKQQQQQVHHEHHPQTQRQQRMQVASKSKGCSSMQMKATAAAMPVTSLSSSPFSSSSSTHYYFYQSALGDHVYLHPLETKVLKHEFGGYDKFPERISVEVLSVQESTVVGAFSILLVVFLIVD